MTRKKRTYRELQDYVLENLQDPQEAAAYLNAALNDGDECVLLLAIRDVVEARGETIADLAEETSLNKQNLYRMLSEKGNPRLTSIIVVLNAIGFNLGVQLKKK